jgi:hypothetical protein
MAFKATALQRQILQFMRTALLEGLPGLDKEGRPRRGVMIRARDAVHDAWIHAALMPIDRSRVGRFRSRLERAIEELRLRRCIEPVAGDVKTAVWRWRRPDGKSVLLAYHRGRKGFDVEMSVGWIRRGKLSGIGTRATAESPAYYRLLPEGLAVLDRMARRARAPRRSPESGKRKRSPRGEPAIGSEIEVDESTFMVRAEGKAIRYVSRGKLLFQLLARLARSPGCWVPFHRLLEKDDVWDGRKVSDGTVKGAVSRLRKFLTNSGLPKTAQRLVVGTYAGKKYVVLNLPGVEP